VVWRLIESGADVDIPNEQGETAITKAGNEKIRLLLERVRGSHRREEEISFSEFVDIVLM